MSIGERSCIHSTKLFFNAVALLSHNVILEARRPMKISWCQIKLVEAILRNVSFCSRSVFLHSSMIVTKIQPVAGFEVQLGCNHHLHLLFSLLSISCCAREVPSSPKAFTSVSHGWSFDEMALLCGLLSEKTKTAIKSKQIGSCYGNSILC